MLATLLLALGWLIGWHHRCHKWLAQGHLQTSDAMTGHKDTYCVIMGLDMSWFQSTSLSALILAIVGDGVCERNKHCVHCTTCTLFYARRFVFLPTFATHRSATSCFASGACKSQHPVQSGQRPKRHYAEHWARDARYPVSAVGVQTVWMDFSVSFDYIFLFSLPLSPFSWAHAASYSLICLQLRPSACKASRCFNNSINACECAGQVGASDLEFAKRLRSSLLRIVQRDETARNTALHYEADGQRISTTAPRPIREEFWLDIRVVSGPRSSFTLRLTSDCMTYWIYYILGCGFSCIYFSSMNCGTPRLDSDIFWLSISHLYLSTVSYCTCLLYLALQSGEFERIHVCPGW